MNCTSYSLLVRNLIRTCFRYLKLTSSSSSSVVILWLVTDCWCCFCWRCLLELGVSTAAWVKESDSAVLVPSTLWAGTLSSRCSVFFMSLSLCCRTRIFCKGWMKTYERTKTRLTTYCQHKYQQKLSEAVTLFFSVNCSSNSFTLLLSSCSNVAAACLSCSTTSKLCTRFNNSSESTFIFSISLNNVREKYVNHRIM